MIDLVSPYAHGATRGANVMVCACWVGVVVWVVGGVGAVVLLACEVLLSCVVLLAPVVVLVCSVPVVSVVLPGCVALVAPVVPVPPPIGRPGDQAGIVGAIAGAGPADAALVVDVDAPGGGAS
ncbi:MAG TPA: hypothetical protein VIT64_09655 [Ilumatobacteraceae bacterium]